MLKWLWYARLDIKIVIYTITSGDMLSTEDSTKDHGHTSIQT